MEEDRSIFFVRWTISFPNGRGSELLFRKKRGIVSFVNNCFPDKDNICEYFPISSEAKRSIYR